VSALKPSIVLRRTFFPFIAITLGLSALAMIVLASTHSWRHHRPPPFKIDYPTVGILIILTIALCAFVQWWIARCTRYTLHEDHIEIATWFLDPARAHLQRVNYSALLRVDVTHDPFQLMANRATLVLVTAPTSRRLVKGRQSFLGYSTRITTYDYAPDLRPMKLHDVRDWQQLHDFIVARIPVTAQPVQTRTTGRGGAFGQRGL
jgi:membrane protein YdbS with pleckstrin-like domain